MQLFNATIGFSDSSKIKSTEKHTLKLTHSPTPTPEHTENTFIFTITITITITSFHIPFKDFTRASMTFRLCFLCWPIPKRSKQASKQTTLNPTSLHDIHLISVPYHLTIIFFRFNQLLTRSSLFAIFFFSFALFCFVC